MTKTKQLLIGGSGCWLGFVILMLAYLHGRGWINGYDRFGYQLVQPASPAKTTVLCGITMVGDPTTLGVATIILMLLLWWRQRIDDSMWFGAVNFLSGLLVFVLTLLSLLWPFLRQGWQDWLASLLAAIVILTIMYSRVYLRVHYASDVTAGLLLGAGWFMLASALRPCVHEWLTKPVTHYPD